MIRRRDGLGNRTQNNTLSIITRIMAAVLVLLTIILAVLIYFKMTDTKKADSGNVKDKADLEQAAGTAPAADPPAALPPIQDIGVGTIVDKAQVDSGLLDQYFIAVEIDRKSVV